MLAVLRDAIFTFLRTADAPTVRRRRLFRETAAWFESADLGGPFAFLTICDTLGIDPAYLRRGLDRARGRQRAATRGASETGVLARAAG
jgi:hypothetical protein